MSWINREIQKGNTTVPHVVHTLIGSKFKNHRISCIPLSAHLQLQTVHQQQVSEFFFLRDSNTKHLNMLWSGSLFDTLDEMQKYSQ